MTIMLMERRLLADLASVIDGSDAVAIERARQALRRFYREVLE